MLVNEDGTITLTQTQLVHFVRPSADLLFESVAASFGKQAIAVVLTGSGSDGSLGVQAIKNTGGFVIVQEVKSAQFTGMPNAAIETGAADLILPLENIAEALMTLILGKA
jgi:two-component system chemotaxis response regulator CheB